MHSLRTVPVMSDDHLALISAAQSGTLSERMGMRLTRVDHEAVEASMPVAGNTQPFGLLHGGANAALAETVGSIAALVHAGEDREIVGIELSCSHHRAVTSGHVHAVATALHEGNTLATYAITITDDAGRLVCSSRLTCLVRPQRKS